MAVEIKSKYVYSIAHKELRLSSHSLWKWERYCDEQGKTYVTAVIKDKRKKTLGYVIENRKRVSVTLGLLPVAWVGGVVALAIRARFFLGYWPKPAQPDPKLL